MAYIATVINVIIEITTLETLIKSVIHYKLGNLLTVREGIIVHGCNCRGEMGAGVAKAVRDAYAQLACTNSLSLVPLCQLSELPPIVQPHPNPFR